MNNLIKNLIIFLQLKTFKSFSPCRCLLIFSRSKDGGEMKTTKGIKSEFLNALRLYKKSFKKFKTRN